MHDKTKLELLRAMQRRRTAAKAGFTLVEVLVVAGILAILFASLVPNLLRARARAAASAVISESVGLARACQGVQASGVGTDTFQNPTDAANRTCSGANPTVVTFASRTWNGDVSTTDNIRCLATTISSVAGTPADVTVTVNADGTMTCVL